MGEIDLSFADQGRFQDFYPVANLPNYPLIMLENSDSTQLWVEDIGSGSGKGIGLSELDSDGQLLPEFGQAGVVDWTDPDFPESPVEAFRVTNGNTIVRTSARNNISFIAFDEHGQVDESFGDQGVLRIGFRLDWGSRPHPGGGFLLLEQDNLQSVLTRFTNSGDLDGNFGNQGVVRFPAIFQPQLHVTPLGKILVFGSRIENNASLSVIFRLNPDGSTDTDFGPGGVRTAEAPYLQRMYMAPQADAYFTVQSSDDEVNRTYAVSRYTDNLELDTTFGDQGTAEFSVPKGWYAYNLFVQPTSTGGIFIQQSWREFRGSRVVIASLNSVGTLDSTFGGGIVQLLLEQQDIFTRTFQVGSSGEVYVLGSYQPELNANWKSDGIALRFTSTGELDTSWGNSGFRSVDRTLGTERVDTIDLVETYRSTPQIRTGWQGYESFDYGVGRLFPTGTTQVGPGNPLGSPEFRQPRVIGAADGGWYALSPSGSGNYVMRIRRYLSDGQPALNFGEQGELRVNTSYPHEVHTRLDGQGAVTIVVSDYETTADPSEGLGVATIIRISPAGELDAKFGEQGILRLYEKPAAVKDVLVSPSLGIALVYWKTEIQAFDFTGQPLPGFGDGGFANSPSFANSVWEQGDMDEAGNLYGLQSRCYTEAQCLRLIKINREGGLDTNFGQLGSIDLPLDWNAAYNTPQISVQSGLVLIANAHGRSSARIRLLAYDYDGKPLEELGGSGIRDYELAPNGESVTDLEIADDGSIWMSLTERRGPNQVGAVYKLHGSSRGQMHHWYNALDVNRDAAISAIDALLVINQINTATWDGQSRPDVNNDNFLTPLDALLVINYLNRQDIASGEQVDWSHACDMNWLWWDQEQLRRES